MVQPPRSGATALWWRAAEPPVLLGPDRCRLNRARRRRSLVCRREVLLALDRVRLHGTGAGPPAGRTH